MEYYEPRPVFCLPGGLGQSDRLSIEFDETTVVRFSMTPNDPFLAGAQEPSGLFDL
jgi:hypothetical protein